MMGSGGKRGKGRKRTARDHGAFSINSFARKRLFLPMIYGFPIRRSTPTDPPHCAKCTSALRCEEKLQIPSSTFHIARVYL